jgi:threonine dehydratase
MQSYVRRILDARVYEVAVESPLDRMPLMSQRLRNRVWLKREDLQPVFSFKLRGAYNRMRLLSPKERVRGVVAASAGNHAQGVAMAAAKLGTRATIVMPRTTPGIKIDAVTRLGAKVVLDGDTYDEAHASSRTLAHDRRMVYVHPYDDPDVIAGQGTVAMEILRQHPGAIDAVFVPVGGGGLCAGIAAYLAYVRPTTAVIGVQPEESANLEAAMRAGAPVKLPRVGLFADGVAVARIGDEPFRILKGVLAGVVTVTTDEICAAIKDIFEDTRSIAEPAGALALAGLKKHVARRRARNKTFVVIDSGANMNFDRLRYISERTETGERREAVLAVSIPEQPGSFLRFCRTLGPRMVTEFNYRYADPGTAHIFVGVQVAPDGRDRRALVEQLKRGGYPVTDLTDSEMAKLHVRHMVGGHAPLVEHEVVYRFEFPERPGALLQFLETLGARWNISMFHYRNHGAADGRVLAGLQVPPAERRRFVRDLATLHYHGTDVTGDEAYEMFLGAAAPAAR